MPGAEGSAEERANKLEVDLKKAQNRIAALEAAVHTTPGGVIQRIAGDPQALRDGARQIAKDIREGKPVSPDDIFRASQPLMRDLAPLFDRMRVKDQQRWIDSTTGELARKYDLGPEQQQQLKQWFERKAADESKRWNELVQADGTRLQDLMKASRNTRSDDGLDTLMPAILSGDKLEQFQGERMTQRAQQVQQEADMKVQRLDGIVHLDEAQRDQVFGIMARNSKNYDPKMALEGAIGTLDANATGDPEEAMLFVLRPDQRAAYEAERTRRRAEAAKDMEAVGLALPSDWNMFGDDRR
jgi:hypothetical protein